MATQARWVMGTLLKVTIDAPAAPGPIFRRAFAEVDALDRLLSTYRPQSALSELNRRSPLSNASVDQRLHAILRRCVAYSEATAGAFDITVGPLMRLYRDQGPPTAAQIARSLAQVGFRGIVLTGRDRLSFTKSLRLDAGGIGKGLAVDAMVAVLARAGVKRAFIDFGSSSFYGLGAPRGQRGWPVQVAPSGASKPLSNDIVYLRDRALSSSRSFRVDGAGRTVFHIVDPRSGAQIKKRRYAVVISSSGTDAEVWSTALVVDPALRKRAPRGLLITIGPDQIESANGGVAKHGE